MATTQRRYKKEEIAQLGDAIFDRDVRPRLAPSDEGKFVAIDIESAAFLIKPGEIEACDALRAVVPNAQVWMVRVGSRFVHRFASSPLRRNHY